MKPPPGGWFDSKGIAHRANALACEKVNNRLNLLWVAIDNLVPIRESGLAENPSFSEPGDPNADDEQKALRAGFDKVVLALSAIAAVVYSLN